MWHHGAKGCSPGSEYNRIHDTARYKRMISRCEPTNVETVKTGPILQ